jgi:hypothetical protein
MACSDRVSGRLPCISPASKLASAGRIAVLVSIFGGSWREDGSLGFLVDISKKQVAWYLSHWYQYGQHIRRKLILPLDLVRY